VKQIRKKFKQKILLSTVTNRNTYAFVKQQERSDWWLTMFVRKKKKEKER